MSYMAFSLLVSGITSNGEVFPNQATYDHSTSKGSESILIYPEEYLIYRDYIEVIGGKPGKCDTGTIEATVLSITRGSICPGGFDSSLSGSERCSTELYPKDTGIVRIDKVIDYRLLGSKRASSVVSQSSQHKSARDWGTDADAVGTENAVNQLRDKKQYVGLREGGKVDTIFLLTAQPVVIKYSAIIGSAGGLEYTRTPKHDDQTTVSKKVESTKRNFKPLPRSNKHFVFTTRIGSFPGEVLKKLPGLEVGSKFRARIRFNGQLYVDEYERRE